MSQSRRSTPPAAARVPFLFLIGTLFLLLIAAGASAGSAAASPVADKKARLKEVQAKLDKVGVQVEKAVEYYNQANTRLDTVKGRIAENQRRLVTAERNLGIANRQLSMRAASIYKNPDTSFMDVFFAARSFDDLVAQADMMQRLGNSDVDLVHSASAYRQDIRDRRLSLEADKKSAVKLVAQRSAQKTDVLAAEASLQNMESGLKADIKAALKAQQEAAQRAAAARAAAAAGSYAGGSGGSAPPAVDPGGPGHPEVVAIAQRYLGIMYVWGGASPSQGFDCSGLVLYVYNQVGIHLSHGATDQQHASTPVPLSALQPGDLVFYGSASYSHHVAIYVGGGQTIEAAHSGAPVRYGVVGSAWIGGRF